MTDPDILQALLEVYESPGWAVVEATAQKRREDAVSRLLKETQIEEVRAVQAEIRTLDWLLGLPDEARRQNEKAARRPSGGQEGEG